MALSLSVSELHDLKFQLALLIRRIPVLNEIIGEKSIADFALLLDKSISRLKQSVSQFPSFDLSLVLINQQLGINVLDFIAHDDIPTLMSIHQTLRVFVERHQLMAN